MIQIPKKDIDDIVYDILKKSKSFDVFPTPIDKILKYCELKIDKENNFHIPKNYFSKGIDVLKGALKKILGVLDREEKIIYVDPLLHESKKTFIKLHETGHNALPWQREIRYVDNEYTLSPEVKEQFEAEANFFASASLFQLNRFEDEMQKLPLEIGSPILLANKFGSSIHSSIRRYAQYSKKRCGLIILEKIDLNEKERIFTTKGLFYSNSFTSEFGKLIIPSIDADLPFINDFQSGKKQHKDGKIQFETLIGNQEFEYHYFFNHYNIFILVIPPGEKNKVKTKIIVNPSISKIQI